MRRDALLWNFTVLGEAATKVSEEVRSANVEIPWARPARLRNRIVHGYWSLDLDVLVATASRDLPAFVAQLEEVQSQLDDE